MEAGSVSRPRGTIARTIERERTATALALVALTALALGLRFALFAQVAANPFYDAAVRSMGQSWHNFFFGAFEPGGQVSIDKTPVDLWLQVASTKLFGFSATALRLPEAIASTLAVPFLYDVVRRIFGRPAGLASAAVLAVLPVAVLTGRSDTMDSLMMLLLVACGWLIVHGAQTQRTRWLIGAGAVLGLAFNVKLFEALVAAPALIALAVVASPFALRRTIGALAAAATAFVAVALSWVSVASLLAGHHPWPIGSTNGGVWNVLFVYNGLDRLRVPPTRALAALDPAGPLRLFSSTGAHHGMLIGSALIVAIALGVAALAWFAPALWRDRAAHGRLRRAGVVWIGLWLISGLVFFSQMARLHPRYLEAMTPAVAAAAGIGLTGLAGAARAQLRPAVLLLAAAALSVFVAVRIGQPAPAAVAGALIGLATAAAGLAWLAAGSSTGRRTGVALLAAGALVAVLAVPLAGSLRIVGQGSSDSGRPGAMPAAKTAALSAFLTAHQGSARYELASSSVAKAGPLIVRDGRPVLMLTSLYGRPLLTPAQLSAKVAAGEVRYVLLARCPPRAAGPCAPVVRWAQANSTNVSGQAGLPARGSLHQFTGAP